MYGSLLSMFFSLFGFCEPTSTEYDTYTCFKGNASDHCSLSYLLLLMIKNIYSIDQTILVHSLMLKTHFVLSFFYLLYIFLVTRFFLLLCRLASEEKDGLRQKKKKQKAGLFWLWTNLLFGFTFCVNSCFIFLIHHLEFPSYDILQLYISARIVPSRYMEKTKVSRKVTEKVIIQFRG